eukprot:jgi/Mesen1/947/ME000118S00119
MMAGIHSWQVITAAMSESLRLKGLDLVAPLSLAWYNAAVPENLHLPSFGAHDEFQGESEGPSGPQNERRTEPEQVAASPAAETGQAKESCLGVLVGNTRVIWDHFVRAYRANDMGLQGVQHPINTYVAAAICAAAEAAYLASLCHLEDASRAQSQPHALTGGGGGDRQVERGVQRPRIFWAHDTQPGKLVAIQRAAHVAGMAYLDKVSHLCMHPQAGPWFSLRALVLFDADPPPTRPPQLRNFLSAETQSRVKAAMARALTAPLGATHDDCSANGSAQPGPFEHSGSMQKWRLWLAVRDAIDPSSAWRFSEEQIEYHYRNDRSLLSRLLEKPDRGERERAAT